MRSLWQDAKADWVLGLVLVLALSWLVVYVTADDAQTRTDAAQWATLHFLLVRSLRHSLRTHGA